MIPNSESHRFTLERNCLGGGEKLVTLLMLNPSTADEYADDPTIRRCVSFARREGAGTMRVVNLFADRATQPNTLLNLYDDATRPTESELSALSWGLDPCDVAIAAWGGHSGKLRRLVHERVDSILDAVLLRVGTLHCLGTTEGGDPCHPLYVRGETPLARWPHDPAEEAQL